LCPAGGGLKSLSAIMVITIVLMLPSLMPFVMPSCVHAFIPVLPSSGHEALAAYFFFINVLIARKLFRSITKIAEYIQLDPVNPSDDDIDTGCPAALKEIVP